MSLAWNATKRGTGTAGATDTDTATNAALVPWSLYDWCAIVGLGMLAGATLAAVVELVVATFN